MRVVMSLRGITSYVILWKLLFINVINVHLYLLFRDVGTKIFFFSPKKIYFFKRTRYSNGISTRIAHGKVGEYALMRTSAWHELSERAITIHDSCSLSKSKSISFSAIHDENKFKSSFRERRISKNKINYNIQIILQANNF